MRKDCKLIIVDDHKMFLDGVSSIIAHNSKHVVAFTANNGLEVKNYLETHPNVNIDLVVLDINMPELDGIGLNKYIKEKHPSIKTLVISMLAESDKIYELTQDDVDGYLPKNAQKKELLYAIDCILNGQKYFSESIQKAYTDSVFGQEKEKKIAINNREKEILELIAKEYTTQEIADQLCLSKYTIEGYRKSLISKLKVKNVVGLAKYAIKLGLVE